MSVRSSGAAPHRAVPSSGSLGESCAEVMTHPNLPWRVQHTGTYSLHANRAAPVAELAASWAMADVPARWAAPCQVGVNRWQVHLRPPAPHQTPAR